MRSPDWPAIAAMGPEAIAAEIDEIEGALYSVDPLALNTQAVAAIVFLARHLTPEPEPKESRDHE